MQDYKFQYQQTYNQKKKINLNSKIINNIKLNMVKHINKNY